MKRQGQPALWQAWEAWHGVEVEGRDRVALLHRLSSQDLRPLAAVGRAARSLCLTPQGRLVDWVGCVSGTTALSVATSAGRAAAVAAWIDGYTIAEDVRARPAPPAGRQRLLLVGAGAAAAAGAVGLPAAPAAGVAAICGEGDAAIVWQPALAAWGEGLEAWVPAARVDACRAALTAAGAACLTPAGLERRRLEAGIPGPAGEYPGAVNPLELRLAASSVSWNSGCYIGQEVISRLDSYRKVARLLVGISAPAPAGPADGPWRVLVDGAPVGRITSWQVAPAGGIGLAVVKRAAATPRAVDIEAGGHRFAGVLALPPFCR